MAYSQRFTLINCILTAAFWIPPCHSSGKLTIQLLSYRNPGSQVYDGSCCDGAGWCIDSCDNYFQLCLATPGASNKCALYKKYTGVTSSDWFNFPRIGGSLGKGLTNPVTYGFDKWKPLTLNVEVWDDDGQAIIGTANDFVDQYTLTVSGPAQQTKAVATPKKHRLTGRQSYLDINVKVFCDPNYLIPDCSIYCVPRDDDLGHYTCDYTKGRKVCRDGWYGDACLVWCQPRNDSRGHYSCGKEGDKVCLQGWAGENCTEGAPTILPSSLSVVSRTAHFARTRSAAVPLTPTSRHIPSAASSTSYISPKQTTKQYSTTSFITPAVIATSNRTSSTVVMVTKSSSVVMVTKSSSVVLTTSTPHPTSGVPLSSRPMASSTVHIYNSKNATPPLSTSIVPRISSSMPLPRITSAGPVVIATPTSRVKLCQSSSAVSSASSESIMMEIVPSEGKALDLKAIQQILMVQLNQYCTDVPMECGLGCYENSSSTTFRETDVQVEAVKRDGESLTIQVIARLPGVLQGTIPSKALLEVADVSKEKLEDMTSSRVVRTWVVTSDDSNDAGKTGKRKSDVTSGEDSVLTFSLAGAGIAVSFVVIVIVVGYRFKRSRNKKLKINPLDDDIGDWRQDSPTEQLNDKASLIEDKSTSKDESSVIELSAIALARPLKTPPPHTGSLHGQDSHPTPLQCC